MKLGAASFRLFHLAVVFVVLVFDLATTATSIRYERNWKSLDSRPLPVWFDNAKIGIFIHWGVFSVPSYVSEWFWSFWKDPKRGQGHVKIVQYMERYYKKNFTYADFAADFTAEHFDATQWADLIEASGARYAVLTTKHHEGFTLWPSTYSSYWNSVQLGPKRNLVDEFVRAIRHKNGKIHLGLYYSLFEWFNPLFLRDQNNKFQTHDYVKEKARPELEELINTFKPELLWSDGDGVYDDVYWNSTDILAWLYNDSPVKDVIVTNDRWGLNCDCRHGGFLDCNDRETPGSLPKRKWESAQTIDYSSWGYRRDMSLTSTMSPEDLIKTLLSTISFGGNFLINVGPAKDGRIMPIFEERLRQMGQWLSVNGEAIYESKIYQTCQTVNKTTFYTSKTDAIYGATLEWPENSEHIFTCIDHNKVKKVQLLGTNAHIKFGPAGDKKNGTMVQFPRWTPNSNLKYAYVFKFVI